MGFGVHVWVSRPTLARTSGLTHRDESVLGVSFSKGSCEKVLWAFWSRRNMEKLLLHTTCVYTLEWKMGVLSCFISNRLAPPWCEAVCREHACLQQPVDSTVRETKAFALSFAVQAFCAQSIRSCEREASTCHSCSTRGIFFRSSNHAFKLIGVGWLSQPLPWRLPCFWDNWKDILMILYHYMMIQIIMMHWSITPLPNFPTIQMMGTNDVSE